MSAQTDPAAGQDAPEAHPPYNRWRVELLDGDQWMAVGSPLKASGAAHRVRAEWDRIQPSWADGTAVQRRVVRETTTYTVEQPR